MKYVILPCFLFLFASCSRPNVDEMEIPVSKSIEFRMAQAADYSAAVYDGVQAEVRLTISKQLAGTSASVVLWDTLIPYQSIRVYPPVITPLVINKQISEVFESKETIRFSKVIRYKNSLNQISLHAAGEDIPSFIRNKLVEVDL